jgi:hypothetical protein
MLFGWGRRSKVSVYNLAIQIHLPHKPLSQKPYIKCHLDFLGFSALGERYLCQRHLAGDMVPAVDYCECRIPYQSAQMLLEAVVPFSLHFDHSY